MKDEIKKFWKGDIDDSPEALAKYSRDASMFAITPALVVYSRDAKDISELVKWANVAKRDYPNLSLTVRSAGTDMSGGPLNDSIIIDVTRYMNRIISINQTPPEALLPRFPGAAALETSGEGIAEVGCFYRDFETATLAKGLLLPAYTASKSINALGGMIGNNSGGELALRYGKTEDYVKELSVVLSDGYEYSIRPLPRRELMKVINEQSLLGNIYKGIYELIEDHGAIIESARPHVTKNSAGYYLWNVWSRGVTPDEDIFDLGKLFVGSQGTLGIATKATFRLVKNIVAPKLVVVFVNDYQNLGEIVSEIEQTKPLSFESYDDKTFKLAMKFFKDLVKSKGLWGTLKMGLSFLPEFFMVLRGGVPKLFLLVEYDGSVIPDLIRNPEPVLNSIQDPISKLRDICSKWNLRMHIVEDEREAEKYWAMRRDSFALLRKHAEHMRTAPFIDDVIVPIEHMSTFLPELNALVAAYPSLIYTIAGHAGNGNFHIIPLVDPADPKLPEIVRVLSQDVYKLVVKYGGSITAEHNDGLIRTPFLSYQYSPEIIKLFEQVKTIFDPASIFNPHKKVGCTLDYSLSHLQPSDTPHSS